MNSLIYSNINDASTNNVIDWFLFFKKEFKRYNGLDNFESKKKFIFYNNFYYEEISNNDTILNKINSIWFRRPSHDLINIEINKLNTDNVEFKEKIDWYSKFNDKIFKEFYVRNNFSNKLGSYTLTGLNKPIVLKKAAGLGIKIPETIITDSKTKVICFFKKHKSIINKALHESFMFSPKNETYWISNKTKKITKEEDIPNNFKMSLFQENIDKQYEIRSFFLNNKFYSACIFSQKNEKTCLDFRNYDINKPNRVVPFKLPKDIESKLICLMNDLKLNTGSIDIIRSISGEYIFLEINPVGQYGFVSFPCNYNLDYKIYKFLTNEK